MIALSALITVAALVSLLFTAMDSLQFLAPYRDALLSRHGVLILAWFGMVAVNVYFLALQLTRRLGLRGAGARLEHLEREGVLAERIRALTLDPQD